MSTDAAPPYDAAQRLAVALGTLPADPERAASDPDRDVAGAEQ